MKLYEVPAAYADLDARAEDGEDIALALATLDGTVVQKAEAVLHVMKNLDAASDAFGAEIKRLQERKRTADHQAERIRTYLKMAMEAASIARIKAGTFSVSLGEGVCRVEIEDESMLPEAYVRVKKEPNKAAILAAFKETGEIVRGSRIERGTRLVIR
jgi:hypothetical protein